jgi:hypothetical protein
LLLSVHVFQRLICHAKRDARSTGLQSSGPGA